MKFLIILLLVSAIAVVNAQVGRDGVSIVVADGWCKGKTVAKLILRFFDRRVPEQLKFGLV